jgi:glycosyltransferase involved in cell wall biosynthesis
VKILYHHRVLSKDGQAVHVECMIEALRGAGHDVIVVGPPAFESASFGHEPKLLGRVKALIPKALYEILEIAYNVAAYWRLRKAANAFKPDVLYERYNLNLLAGVWLKRQTGVRMLLEVNAPLAREREEYGGIGLKRLTQKVERFIWGSADFVLPVSNVLAGEIRSAGVAASQIAVIPNAIDPGDFSPAIGGDSAKSELRLDGKTVLGFVGFVRSWHGLDAILDWLAQPDSPPSMHLLLVGEGPELPALKEQAAQLGIEDRVHFTGLVDREMAVRMVSAFDIALQPKCVEYASPLKLFEYMALGKAIVAPDQPNIRELLDADVSALLFDPQSRTSLIAAIRRLGDDPDLRKRVGTEARRTIGIRGLTWAENARRVAALAEAAIARP